MAPPPSPTWLLSPARSLSLARPAILAILNLTPDSFAPASRVPDASRARDAALAAVAAGADMLDLGAESTRPGAPPIDEHEQLARLLPSLRAIRAAHATIPISIDTTLPAVARAALDDGADAINDVSAGTDPRAGSPDAMLHLAAQRRAGIVLMHRALPPQSDRYSDQYPHQPPLGDAIEPAVDAVDAFLRARAARATALGIDPRSLIIDPGLGFGKSVEQNLALIAATPRWAPDHRASDAAPPAWAGVLSALSRKSFVGRVGLGRDSAPDERLPATLALSTLHLSLGARLFRVHDVAEHRAALDAAWALHAHRPLLRSLP